ncbi:MAG TPA: response regulator transcription factor [Candidatus Thiothrix moscowensis]|uniref:response regulator transcription factor n=1 Tax=unclassified Thiothrix TaxID=2636184 RepID=UPI0025DB6800|nr:MULTISPECIES: response regulator transcription factor [unclassified Thiothrix]HRJ54274.1 response regulator transcription factor [Candidatus Thiothrix moscowensis]HRJ94538.1 response regulator transcription factor [Candidatus Thiothrix moscowensis]
MHDSRNILIVDDDSVLQKLLEEYLPLHGFAVQGIANGDKIEDYLYAYSPALVVLDIVLPGKSGLYWLKHLKTVYPQLPVLVLSAQGNAIDRLRGLELGASDYLTKPFHPKELLIRIRNILYGYPTTSHGTLRIGEHLFDPERELLLSKGGVVKLTSLDNQLLHFFCQHPGKILSRDAISHALHGNDHAPLDRSIDMRINRLRKKLEADLSNPRHLHTVWRKGYRFTP